MKKLLFLLFTVVVMICAISAVNCAFADFQPEFVLRDDVMPNVNKNFVCIKEVQKDSDGESVTLTNTFDSKGQMTKQTSKWSDGYTSTDTYTYDSKGNVTKQVSKYQDSVYTYNYTYTYDSKGNMTKKVFNDNDGYTYTETFTYDSKGNLTKEISKNRNNSGKTTTITYTYDSKGNVTKMSSTDDTGITKTFTYTYGSNGKVAIEECSVKGSQYTITYTYDSNGNLTKKSGSKYKYYKEYIAYTYNSKGYVTRATHYFDDKIMFDTHYTYDSNGNVTKIADRWGDISTYSYKQIDGQVTGLSASGFKTTSLTLKWSKYTGAKYYKVEKYDSANKKWVTVKTVDTNSLTVSSLKAGNKYQFRVTALNSSKKKIGTTSKTLTTGTLCSAPTIKLSSTEHGVVKVTLTKVTGASKYIISYSTDNKKWACSGTTTGLSYNIKNLTAGKKVYVKAVAVNAYDKNSAFSSVKSITVKKVTYTVSFSENTSLKTKKGDDYKASMKCVYNSSYALPKNPYTVSGYTFIGWAKSASGKVVFKPGEKIKNLSKTDGAKVTLYAVWEKNQVKIYYNSNGLSPKTLKNNSGEIVWYNANYSSSDTIIIHNKDKKKEKYYQTIEYNKSGKLTSSSLFGFSSVNSGYVFKGWNTKADGSGKSFNETTKYKASDLYSKIATKSATITLYAQYTWNNYTVVFNGNGATSGSMASKKATYNKSFALPLNTFENNGKKFKGWAKSADGEVVYKDGQSGVDKLTKVKDGTVTLYAVWGSGLSVAQCEDMFQNKRRINCDDWADRIYCPGRCFEKSGGCTWYAVSRFKQINDYVPEFTRDPNVLCHGNNWHNAIIDSKFKSESISKENLTGNAFAVSVSEDGHPVHYTYYNGGQNDPGGMSIPAGAHVAYIEAVDKKNGIVYYTQGASGKSVHNYGYMLKVTFEEFLKDYEYIVYPK